MPSLKNETHNSNLENYMVLTDKSRDCILYSEDGSRFSIHKEVFSQTSFLREILYSAKGGLISESFSLWLKCPKEKVTSHYPEHRLFNNRFLRDKSQIENLSDIKQPLKNTVAEYWKLYARAVKKNLNMLWNFCTMEKSIAAKK